jgi:hypothetical protein
VQAVSGFPADAALGRTTLAIIAKKLDIVNRHCGIPRWFRLPDRFVHGEIEHSRHGADLFAHALAWTDKQRVNKAGGRETGLAYQ